MKLLSDKSNNNRKMISLSLPLIAIIVVTLNANSQLSLKFGPESFTTKVENRNVTFVGKGTLKMYTPPGHQRVDVQVASQIDLSGLQQVIPGIVQEKGNRNDDCSEIIRLHTITFPTAAEIKVAGHYEKWDCAIFKKRVGQQDGDIQIALSLKPTNDGKALQVDTKVVALNANGVLGSLLGNSIVGPYLTDWLKDRIKEAIDPSMLKQTFPENLSAYDPKFTSAHFVDLGGNKLGCDIVATFSLSQDQAQKLIDNLRK